MEKGPPRSVLSLIHISYVAYTKDSNEAGTYSEVSKTNALGTGFTTNANSTLNGKTGSEA